MLALGEEGYLALAQKAVDAADRLRAGICALGLELLGAPHATIVTWRARDPVTHKNSTYAVADLLEERGWHIDRQQNPESVHLTVTANHTDVVDQYLEDLAAAVAHVAAHPELQRRGNAAMYGMMAKLPARSFVQGAVQKIMEGMYGPEQKQPDLRKPEGFVGRLLDKYGDQHGDKVLSLLDRIEKLRGRR